MNQWADWNQNGMDITLWHDENFDGFGDIALIFKAGL